MSDVTVADGGAPTSAPAPAPSEVVINENPISSPSPIRNEAPEKPQGEKRLTGREAIQKAFDRAQNPPPKGGRDAPKPAAKPAEARAGHNNPPEETPTLNLKRPPGEQELPRGDGGRFAPRTQTGTAGTPNDAQKSTVSNGASDDTARPPMKKLPDHAPFAAPPARVSEKARYDWADTPESVRGDVHRMHDEFAKAYQYYRNDAEAFKPLKGFHAMATEHGTTLETAFTNYVNMENKLRSDPIAGVDQIIYNLNLQDPETGRRLDIRDLAYTVLSQSPDQMKQVQQGNMQQALAQQIGSVMSEIRDLKNQQQQIHNQQQFTYTRSAVDQFADSHPRFDELGAVIEQELKLGFDIETAYRRAELLHPAAHAPQTRNTSAQTRQVDRSISGSPDVTASNAASRPTRAPREHDRSPRSAIQNAIRRVSGAL